jgi:acyl carrier protein
MFIFKNLQIQSCYFEQDGTCLDRGNQLKKRSSTKMNDTRSVITHILVDNLHLDELHISDNSKLHEDLGIDSLDFCEVIVDIEQALEISIPDEDVLKLTTFGALVSYIENKNFPKNFRRLD